MFAISACTIAMRKETSQLLVAQMAQDYRQSGEVLIRSPAVVDGSDAKKKHRQPLLTIMVKSAEGIRTAILAPSTDLILYNRYEAMSNSTAFPRPPLGRGIPPDGTRAVRPMSGGD